MHEMVTFCGPMHDPARGFDQFRQCLPRLLELRPNCLVVLAWLDIAQTGQKNGPAPAPVECSMCLPLFYFTGSFVIS